MTEQKPPKQELDDAVKEAVAKFQERTDQTITTLRFDPVRDTRVELEIR